MKKRLGRKFYKKLGEFIQIAADCTITKEDGCLVKIEMTLPIGFGGDLYNDTKWVAAKLRQNEIEFKIDIVHEAKDRSYFSDAYLDGFMSVLVMDDSDWSTA